MAVIADPTGAMFCLWQAKNNIGAQLVNEHGTLSWERADDARRARGDRVLREDLRLGSRTSVEMPGMEYTELKLGDRSIGGAMKPPMEGMPAGVGRLLRGRRHRQGREIATANGGIGDPAADRHPARPLGGARRPGRRDVQRHQDGAAGRLSSRRWSSARSTRRAGRSASSSAPSAPSASGTRRPSRAGRPTRARGCATCRRLSGGCRNGRRAPSVTIAMRVSVELAELAVGVPGDAVVAVAVVVARRARRARTPSRASSCVADRRRARGGAAGRRACTSARGAGRRACGRTCGAGPASSRRVRSARRAACRRRAASRARRRSTTRRRARCARTARRSSTRARRRRAASAAALVHAVEA